MNKPYLLLAALLLSTVVCAQKVNSLEALKSLDYQNLVSEEEHGFNVKFVTIADSILNADLHNVINEVQPWFMDFSRDNTGGNSSYTATYLSAFGFYLEVTFDSKGTVTRPFSYKSIPCTVYKDERHCTFISAADALTIAKKAFRKKGELKPEYNTIHFDADSGKHFYAFTNVISEKGKNGVIYGKYEDVYVEAQTGQVIHQEIYKQEDNRKYLESMVLVGDFIIPDDDRGPERNHTSGYVYRIDKLKSNGTLNKVSLPDMSACWGALDGYYEKGKLVLMEATYKAEMGYSTRRYYLSNNEANNYVAIFYEQHLAEWDIYTKKYPSDTAFDASKMTYTDVLCAFEMPVNVTCVKTDKGEAVSNDVDRVLLKELIECGNVMRGELETVKR